MLRITPIAGHGCAITLKVEGRIVGDWVPLLEREILAALRAGKSVEADFRDVTFIDESGRTMLQRVASTALRLTHCSAFIQGLLKLPPPSA